MIKLTEHLLKEVLGIIYSELPLSVAVYAFGSRSTGTTRKSSDLDLLLDSPTPTSWEKLSLIEETFADSDLPFRVDLLDKHRTNEHFLHQIANSLYRLDTQSHEEAKDKT